MEDALDVRGHGLGFRLASFTGEREALLNHHAGSLRLGLGAQPDDVRQGGKLSRSRLPLPRVHVRKRQRRLPDPAQVWAAWLLAEDAR